MKKHKRYLITNQNEKKEFLLERFIEMTNEELKLIKGGDSDTLKKALLTCDEYPEGILVNDCDRRTVSKYCTISSNVTCVPDYI